MRASQTLLCVSLAAALLPGCKKKEESLAAPAATTASEAATPATTLPTPAAAPAADPVTAQVFDFNAVQVSDKPLGVWPYIAPPAGYAWDDADEITKNTKDLARVPVWTGGELLWVEVKVFSEDIEAADGKTYSRFEVRKGIEQAIAAIGGQRIGERSFDEAVYRANEKALSDFNSEFSDMSNAYWYNQDADTYLVRRADKAIWFVTTANNDRTVMMVAEGPLPAAPAQ